MKNDLKKTFNLDFIWQYLANKRAKYDHEKIFTKIIRKNIWEGKESVSGPGSNLEQTKIIREAIGQLIKDLKVFRMLDIPCGDFHWMKHVDLNNVKYIGADIVKSLIRKNTDTYGKREGVSFRLLNLINDPLPKADLILCRDCLVHFSFHDIFLALKNICQSDSTFLLTTNFPEHKINNDINTGKWRFLNLNSPPFNMPAPILTINEGCTEREKAKDKSLSLWKIDSIKKSLNIS